MAVEGGGLSRRRFAAAAAAVAGGAGAAGMLGAGSAGAAAGPTAAAAGERAGHGGGRSHRMRGMWIASVNNINWPSRPGLTPQQQKDELLDYYRLAVRRRLNAVYVQIRPTADAFWPSPYEPFSKFLTGTQGGDPGYDPLRFAVAEAHRRGLEFHAWCNPYRISAGPGTVEQLHPDHPARRHPEWTVTYNKALLYNPGLPEVRRHVQDAMLHAALNYDIDALHWDDYFYPYPVAGQVFDDEAAFREHGGDFENKADWRRHNIDLLVSETAARIRRRRPKVRFGISPFAVWRNARTDPEGSATTAGVQTYDDLYADTRGWVRKGWIDYVVPQVYWNIGFAAADYAELVPWWARQVRGTGVDLYIGEGLYKAGDPAQGPPWHDPAELSRHLDLCHRYRQVGGNVFYSAKQVRDDPIGMMTRVVEDHYRHGHGAGS